MKELIKKQIAIISIILLLFLQVGPRAVYAQAPTPPAPPSAPSAPTAPPAPEAPSAPEASSAPEAPSAPSPDDPNNEEEEQQQEDEPVEEALDEPQTSQSNLDPSPSPTSSSVPLGDQSGFQNSDGGMGDTSIDTGDATNNANLVTSGNNNLAEGAGALAGGEDGGITVANSGNGSNSDNSGSAGVINTNQTFQDNSAKIANNLDQSTITGENSASDNTGGDVAVTTGDANTTGTIITSVNTNVAGVAVAEFNVADDHIGDIILDFDSGCIVGCGVGPLSALNSGNGTGSENDANIDNVTNNLTFQNNDAGIENSLTLESNSGDNEASRNTGGDTKITTGDANVAANILTMANNNIAGNVIYSVVNIFGDLVGDIIFPENAMDFGGCSNCEGDILAKNSGNGTNSDNNLNVDQTTNDETYQFNDAIIENNLYIDGQTGGNKANANTNGDTEIDTGNVDVTAQVLNVANSNVVGDWWLVIVNEAGNWIGKIMGAPEGANFAGSVGTEFSVNENGDITASNLGNGSGSNNNANISDTQNNTLVQTNTANLVNNVNLSANTGGNKSTDNTGGASSIKTGDANIVANMANFVNNNIAKGGRLFVTVVNVFDGGSWKGNFITPGSEQEQLAQGSNNSEQQNSGDNGGNTNKDDNSSGGTQNSGGGSSNNSSGNNITTNLSVAPNQPNTTVASSNGFSGAVAGAFAQVAGFKADGSEGSDPLALGEKVTKNVLKINLAWLLLVLPIGLLYLAFVNRSRLSNLLPKKD